MKLTTGEHRVLVIPDLQAPYEHPDALAFVQAVAAEHQCDTVMCVGDEVDQMAMSRFDPDPDADSAGVELIRAREHLAAWYEAFPETKVCTSNHTNRVYKAAYAAGIAEEYIRPINEWLHAPEGWEWADEWRVDGVKYEHGDAAGGMYAARNLAQVNRESTVIGHHHAHATVAYIANSGEMIFGMNVGCLIDTTARAFKYGRLYRFKPTLGCGVVLYGVPYFVPMLLNKKGRWTGEVVV